jgi:hypothetical protein
MKALTGIEQIDVITLGVYEALLTVPRMTYVSAAIFTEDHENWLRHYPTESTTQPDIQLAHE